MRVLVTGAQGFIGSWIVSTLARRRTYVLLHDKAHHFDRLKYVMPEDEARSLPQATGDVGDVIGLSKVMAEHGITHVIHLASLQAPQCRANPVFAAQVNVVGTLAVFEAAVAQRGVVERVVYASAAGVFGPESAYPPGKPVPNDGPFLPVSHDGVFKLANEGAARVYALEYGLTSIGLRPNIVYGPGCELGVSSDPTRAMKAAVLGRPFVIRFTGRVDVQFIEDVAGTFVRCAQADYHGAGAYNMRGSVVSVEEIIQEIEAILPNARGLINAEGDPLSGASDLDDSRLRQEIGHIPRTSLSRGIQKTIAWFQEHLRDGRLDTRDLDG